METSLKAYCKYKKIAVVGLPGSGKTTLAIALLMERKDSKLGRNRKIAFISGDQLLPGNLIKVMSVLENFVAEHFCLSMMLVNRIDIARKCVDLLLYLDLPKEICLARMQARPGHTVNMGLPVEKLAYQITKSISKLASIGIPVRTIGVEELQYICDNELVGEELIEYLAFDV